MNHRRILLIIENQDASEEVAQLCLETTTGWEVVTTNSVNEAIGKATTAQADVMSLALAGLGVSCSLVAQHMYSMPPYAFIARDFTTMSALYTHHQYIAGFLMVGAFSHAAIFWIKDYDAELNKGNVLERVLQHKEAIIAHLS